MEKELCLKQFISNTILQRNAILSLLTPQQHTLIKKMSKIFIDNDSKNKRKQDKRESTYKDEKEYKQNHELVKL